jgi:hypothetical protein
MVEENGILVRFENQKPVVMERQRGFQVRPKRVGAGF